MPWRKPKSVEDKLREASLKARQERLLVFERGELISLRSQEAKLEAWCENSKPQASCHRMLARVRESIVATQASIELLEAHPS